MAKATRTETGSPRAAGRRHHERQSAERSETEATAKAKLHQPLSATEAGGTTTGAGGEAPGRGVGLDPHRAAETSTARAFREQRSPSSWRCRESNPGPPAHHKGFSVCSPLCLYSDPPVMRTSRCDDPSRCLMSRPTPRPGRTVSPLADAGHRSGDAPGPTDASSRSGGEGVRVALNRMVGA